MTKDRRTARNTVFVLLAFALVFALALAPAADAKKKGKKGPGAVDITTVVNAPIPDAQPGAQGLDGTLTSTIDVGKAFQGKRIRDVNVTVQTIGASGADPSDNLQARLLAPNGSNTFLFSSLFGNMAAPGIGIGPLTLDDEALFRLGLGDPRDPTRLYSPWVGAAVPDGKGLWVMDDGPVRGAWTLQITDFTDPETSNLVSWRLNVVAGKPFQTK